MMQYIKANWKRYVQSSVVTFASAFILLLASNIDQLTLESLQTGAYVSLFVVAARAGVKALLELWITYVKTK